MDSPEKIATSDVKLIKACTFKGEVCKLGDTITVTKKQADLLKSRNLIS